MLPYYQINVKYTFKNIEKNHMKLIYTDSYVCLNCMLTCHKVDERYPNADDLKASCPMNKYITVNYTDNEVNLLESLNDGILNNWLNAHSNLTSRVLEIIALRTYAASRRATYLPDHASLKSDGLRLSKNNYMMRFLILSQFVKAPIMKNNKLSMEQIKNKLIEYTRGEIYNGLDLIRILDKGSPLEFIKNKREKIIYA